MGTVAIRNRKPQRGEELLIRMMQPARVARTNVTAWLDRRPRFFLVALNILMFAAVTVLRYLVAPEVYLAAAFLVPVSFAAWFLSAGAGWLTAFASAIVLAIYGWHHDSSSGHGVAYLNSVIDLCMFSFFVFIFSEVRMLYRREQALSLRDPLTGLMNRRALISTVAMENRRMARHHNPLTLAYLDLDDFKKINDGFGHNVGDALLQDIAQVMKKNVRGTDFVARLGGDEFVIVLPETDTTAARSVMSKLSEKLFQQMQELDHAVTFSVGAVTFEVPLTTAAEMIRASDETMYLAKQRGKDRIEYKTIKVE